MMETTVLVNQVVIMEALLSIVTDEKMRKQLEAQIVYTDARIRAML